jgi:hypothetical protein
MKRLLSLFLFLFLGNLSFSATLPLKKQILLEKITVEKDSVAPKEHSDVSKHIMRGAVIAGLILTGWGALESTQPCPPNPFVSLCFNGLGQLILGILFLLIGSLIFLARKSSDAIQYKQAMKNKIK